MPFRSLTVRVDTADGRNVTLVDPLEYVAEDGTLYTVPAGATSDGASTPAPLWPEIPPFGRYYLAAILHDDLYRSTKLPKALCDNLLREAMISLGVDTIMADMIYEGVNVGGWSSFDEDRKVQA